MTATKTKPDRRKIDLRNERRITVAEAELLLQHISDVSGEIADSARKKLGSALLLRMHVCDYQHSFIKIRDGVTLELRRERSKYRCCRVCGKREPGVG